MVVISVKRDVVYAIFCSSLC